MDHPVQSPRIYRFGTFEADLENRELRKHGIRLRLQEKPFKVLMELVRRPGEVVTRDELRQRLWTPDTFVDFDEGVNTAVKRLRSCLGDSAENPVYIETVSRYGYRFIAPVVPVSGKPVPQRDSSPELVIVRPVPAASKPEPEPEKSVWGRLSLRISLITALVVLSGFAIYGNWWRRAQPESAAIQSLVVLPLQNLSGDASKDYFADGITDEITTDLAKLAGPRIISRTSAMHFKGTRKTVPEIARELNVGAVVEGSAERFADRVRVRVQLIEAKTDRHLWAEEYDRQLSDIFQLEGDVARDIALQIQLKLSEAQRQRLARNRPVNPQAFQDYLQGRHYWALRSKESLNKAVEYFNRAVQEDAGDARSYAGLAHCYIVMPMLTGMPQSEALEKAKSAADEAISLDDSLAEAHLAAAEALLYHDWDFAGAENEFRRTLELNPNYSTGHQWYGEFLSTVGRHQEAIREERMALSLDPLSAVTHHQLASALRDGRQYDAAIEQYRKALEISPNFYAVYEAMSWAFLRQGRFVEAIQSLRQAVPGFVNDAKVNPAIASTINALEPAYAKGGAAAYFRKCLKVHEFYMRPHAYLARDYAELSDRDKAIAELSSSYRDHEMEFLSIFTATELDSLRSDPRFQRLIQAVRFSR